MLHFAPPTIFPHAFLPPTPSPLSPRSVNIHGRLHHPNMSTTLSNTTKKSPSPTTRENSASHEKSTPFSQRPVKKAPSPGPEGWRTARRDRFLAKVQSRREDRRFEARGEDMMRADFMQRQRAYERELVRSAPPAATVEDDVEEEEEELPVWSQMSGLTTLSSQREEVDEFARDEEEEVLALLEHMPTDDGQEQLEEEMVGLGADQESLWSDDSDYDALFTEVLLEQEKAGEGMDGVQQQDQQGAGEEMDMS